MYLIMIGIRLGDYMNFVFRKYSRKINKVYNLFSFMEYY